MLAFGMKLVAYDPFVSADRAQQMSVELMSLEELLERSDFVTIHLPKNAETVGLIDAEALARMPAHARLVNTARGGIVVEADLAKALADGVIAGAGLDVFDTEPTTESPLFELPNVVVTPHLGASTAEAQDKAGVTIAEMVLLGLAGDFVPFAVNVAAREAPEALKPYLPLAERLGAFYGALSGKAPDCLEITCSGQIADYDTSLVTLSALRGVFGRISDVPVSFVNAPQLAADHGVEVREAKSSTTHEYLNLVEIRCAGHSVAGTLVGLSGEPRLVMVDDHEVELPPARHMLLVRNDDVPGMIGVVGTAVGDAGINVSDMSLGRSPQGHLALMLLALDQAPSPELVAQIEAHPGVRSVTPIDLGG
jgi:D-3-phosphoglycerate dehydrogenase